MHPDLNELLTEVVTTQLKKHFIPHRSIELRLHSTSQFADVYHAHVDLPDQLTFPQVYGLYRFMDHLTVDVDRRSDEFCVEFGDDIWYLGDGDDSGAAWLDMRKSELVFWVRRFK
jgi:hypothetical protein